MLVVKVEVWPGGDDSRAFEISRIGIANQTWLKPSSDYLVTALLEREVEEKVFATHVYDHKRDHGSLHLVHTALTAVMHTHETESRPYDDPIAQLLRRDGHV